MKHIRLIGESQRDYAKSLINSATPDTVVIVREEKRRDAQNRKFWAMLHDISRAKPLGREHTADTWKLVMMHACGHACAFEYGLDGRPFAAGFRSSDLSVKEMADLITYIAWFGDTHSVKWSEPDVEGWG